MNVTALECGLLSALARARQRPSADPNGSPSPTPQAAPGAALTAEEQTQRTALSSAAETHGSIAEMVGEVIVTGSRTSGFTAPTPVTVAAPEVL